MRMTQVSYPNIPPPLTSNDDAFTSRRKKWMSEMMKEKDAKSKKESEIHVDNTFESADVRDDHDDARIEEDRLRLFSCSSSLSFSIEHYCMMVDKVYITFLKMFKRYCISPGDNNNDRDQKTKTYMLGKRLQFFLKEVLPSHIHYHNDFKGRDQIFTIQDQINEYLDILSLSNDDVQLDGSLDDCSGSGDLFTVNQDFVCNNRHDEYEVRQQTESCEETENECEASCSNSYCSKVDWDNFECAGYEDNDGFSLELDSKADHSDTSKKENDHEFIMQNDSKTYERSTDCDNFTKSSASKIGVQQSEADASILTKKDDDSNELPDFKFTTLVLHWRTQEKKWTKKQTK